MESILQIISHSPLFSGLDRDQYEKISAISVYRSFPKGSLIFSEGDDAAGFFIVDQGSVKVFKSSRDGKEQILHMLGPGEPFGEVPVFSGGSFPANAQAVSLARTIFIQRESFIDLITKNPSLAMNMLGVLSLRLRQFTVQVENLSLKEVPERLAGYLLYLSEKQGLSKKQGLSEKQGNSRRIELDMSKGQLASLLGATPETLSRIFLKMSQQGLIRVNGAAIEILQVEALARAKS